MKVKISEDYFRWCCEWCDTENRVLWEKASEGFYCGACHKHVEPDMESLLLLEAA